MEQRLIVVSPVHNEAAHIERVARAMAAQTRPPDAWIAVDDASSDDTLARLRALEREIPCLTVLSAPPAAPTRDGLARAAEVRAFNFGLESVDWRSFTHVAKLDGDIELPPEWYATLLQRFAADPALGIACGDLVETTDGHTRTIPIPRHHVHGALKLYSLRCLLEIGGVQERLGWDTIDEAYARMRGWTTRSFDDLVGIHHRPLASADGVLRGRARHGACAYIAYQSLPWVAARAVKVGRARPFGIGGAAFLYGYLSAAARGTQRVDDPELQRFVRMELRERALRAFGRVPAEQGS
ncbi:MAG TPA: glycosyltransferase family A protein [Solirubrobacteraceae bacterium]|nr:glycosyltransferase family A protein [Solirubrobacteraceae bacterium]